MHVVSTIIGALLLLWGGVGTLATLSALVSGAGGSAFGLGYVFGLALPSAICIRIGLKVFKSGRTKMVGNAGTYSRT